jgi:cell division protease FtsH
MLLPEKDYSDETARVIDEEIRRIVDEAYRDAERMLEQQLGQGRPRRRRRCSSTRRSRDDVDRLMKGETLNKATISDLLAAEARKAASETRPAPRPSPQGPDLPPGVSPSPA